MKTVLRTLVFLIAVQAGSGLAGDGPPEAYLFAHMTSQDYGGLYYSVSTDGLHWTPLNGGRRVFPDYRGHPDIVRGHDGRYYLVGNPPDDRPDIRIWVSDDLADWTLLGEFRPDLAGLGVNPPSKWHGAPKMFFDRVSKRYVLTWHSASEPRVRREGYIDENYWSSMRTFYVESNDLESWSRPKRMFDFDHATIDVIVREDGGRYYAILKDETHPSFVHPDGKAIRIASADSPTGPWSPASPRVSPNFREAPMLIRRPDGQGWYLYYEQYPGVRYGMSTAETLDGPWWNYYVNELGVPANARHGAMVEISRAQRDFLVEQFGAPAEPAWSAVADDGGAHARHENAFVEVDGRFYLLGGRRLQPVDIFDPGSGQWSEGEAPPIELHHFQAVSHEGLVYVLGAMTGKYPAETPVAAVHVYDPAQDQWRTVAEIPENRRRGAAGAVVHGGLIYLVAGIRDGHRSGWVPWLDVFDPATGRWEALPDAPRARDHFHAAVIDGKIYLAGGRRSGSTRPVFAGTVAEIDVFDIGAGTWSTLPPGSNLPTERAGAATAAVGGRLAVIGGESAGQDAAHDEVELLDPETLAWRTLPRMRTPRHGTQALIHDGALYTAGGNATRGGGDERVALEKLTLQDP